MLLRIPVRQACSIANLATGPVVDAHGFTPIFIGTAVLYPLALLVLLTIPRSSAPSEDSL